MTEFSLKQIEVFVAVAEHGSFTRASEELYLTQSTVSAHIQALEQALGTALFVRQTRRQVHLTPEGEMIYPAAKKILADCRSLSELVQREESDLPLQLGASTVPGQYLLPDLLAGFMKKYTDCRYFLRRGDSAEIHRLLRQGEIRLGFVGAALEPDTFVYTPLAEDRLVMVTENSPRYRRLQQEGIPGKSLLSEPTVAREEGSGTDREIQNYMGRLGFPQEKLQIVARVDDPETIKRMVAQGVGVSILSALAVQREVNDGRLLTFDLDKEGLRRKIYLISRKDIIYTRMEQRFIDYVKRNVN